MFTSVAHPASASRPARIFIAVMVTWLILALPAPAVAAEASEDDKAPVTPYVELGNITVNLQDPSQYLQLKVILKFADPLMADAAKSMTPIILNQIILLLSNRKAEDFSSTGDKMKIMADVKSAVNRALEREHREGASEVLLASFVIQ